MISRSLAVALGVTVSMLAAPAAAQMAGMEHMHHDVPTSPDSHPALAGGAGDGTSASSFPDSPPLPKAESKSHPQAIHEVMEGSSGHDVHVAMPGMDMD